jgi:hypothetical protein
MTKEEWYEELREALKRWRPKGKEIQIFDAGYYPIWVPESRRDEYRRWLSQFDLVCYGLSDIRSGRVCFLWDVHTAAYVYFGGEIKDEFGNVCWPTRDERCVLPAEVVEALAKRFLSQ